MPFTSMPAVWQLAVQDKYVFKIAFILMVITPVLGPWKGPWISQLCSLSFTHIWYMLNWVEIGSSVLKQKLEMFNNLRTTKDERRRTNQIAVEDVKFEKEIDYKLNPKIELRQSLHTFRTIYNNIYWVILKAIPLYIVWTIILINGI